MKWFLALVPLLILFVHWGWVYNDELLVGSIIPINVRYAGVIAVGIIGFCILYSFFRESMRQSRSYKRAPPRQ